MPDWRILDTVEVTNIRAMPRLARGCAELGVLPTYLCNYPVVSNPEAAATMRGLAQDGGCEIGTHIHAWNTPPFASVEGREGDERKHTYYQFELSEEACRAKLRTVHDHVTEVAGGIEPVSFRAGRFGIDETSMQILIDMGYQVDSSITPLVSHAADGGPDFRNAPRFPYLPSKANVATPGSQPIVEIPVSVALTRKLPFSLQRAYVKIPQATRIRGLLSRDYLGLVDFGWLYPVRFDLELMKRVADVLVAQGSPVLNVFLHSSELAPGVSGRIRTEEDVERCFSNLMGILRYCIEEHGARPVTMRDAGRELAPGLGLQPEAAVG